MQKKQKPTSDNLPLPLELIKRRIYIVRGQEVMLDSDLAELYQVETKVLNQTVKRNQERFPGDFMFQLTTKEALLVSQFVIPDVRIPVADPNLRSQIVTSSSDYGGRRYLPYAFTEHGIAMLSSVLKSERAIQMNIFIIRAFIQLRKMLAGHEELSKRLRQAEGILKFHGQILTGLVEDIKRIKNPPKAGAIGFVWRPKKINPKNNMKTMCILVVAFASLCFPMMSKADTIHNSRVCTLAKKQGLASCNIHLLTDAKGRPLVSSQPSGFSPKDLRAAYSLSGTAPNRPIVAIVDAYDDPTIKKDLDFYSKHFSLSTLPDCKIDVRSSAIPCFAKVSQRGTSALPKPNGGWAMEIALDVETVHGVCENCSILLVEATSPNMANLMTAVDTAVRMGANAVSNSYGDRNFPMRRNQTYTLTTRAWLLPCPREIAVTAFSIRPLPHMLRLWEEPLYI